MNIFILSLHSAWTPHFETELEIIANHKKIGDDVFILTDHTYLRGLISNPFDSLHTRLTSKNKFFEGMKIVQIPKKNIFFINNNQQYAHLLPKQFATFQELKEFSLFGVDFGQGVVANIVSRLRDHEVDVYRHADWIYKILQSSLLVYNAVMKIIESHNPDRFYIFNGRFAEVRPAVRACEQKNIPFFTHERGGSIYSYSLFENSMPHSLKYIKKEILTACQEFDEKKRAIGKKWFIERMHGLDQSWLSYTKDQEAQRLPVNFNQNKRNIAIFNSSLDEYESFKEWQPPFYSNENEGIFLILNSFKEDISTHFYLRIHPNLKDLDNTQIRFLKQLNFENLTIIWPDDPVDTYALASASDVVLTFTSTMGIESCFLGKPVILAGRSIYEDLNCCYRPQNHEKLIEYLKSNLQPCPIEGAIMYGYWQATRGIPYKNFTPKGFFDGEFMGKKIIGQLGFLDKIKLKTLDW